MIAPHPATRTLETPVGPLGLEVLADGRVSRVVFGPLEDRDPEGRTEALAAQLGEYFRGERREFALELALDAHGTDFQRRVWRALLRIPYGGTISYRDLAEEVGSVARAVGQANGANPIPVIVPCHRVLTASGGLGGFGGGLETKVALLRLENAWI